MQSLFPCISGEQALRHASGSLLKTIFIWTISIRVSFLHFRQYNGNLINTVSGYTLIFVLLPQIGQGTHLELSFLSSIKNLLTRRLRLCVIRLALK